MSLEIQRSLESTKQTESPVSDKDLQSFFNDFHNLTERQNSPSLDPKVNEMLAAIVVTCGKDGVVAGIAQTKQQAGEIYRAKCLPLS